MSKFSSAGFGFTLKGKDDFKLGKFIAGTPETFDTYYGVNGLQGDGNIYTPENIDALQSYVNKCTMNRGVHIMMADGVRFRVGMLGLIVCLLFSRDFPLKDKKIFKKF